MFVLVEWREIDTQLAGAPHRRHDPGTSRARPRRAIARSRRERAPESFRDELRRALRMGPVRALLDAEGRSHPFVSRVCAELRQSEAVQKGQLTREQALDEIEERAAQCYRNIWTSCSEDEKVVLSHIAQHGLANASVRTVVQAPPRPAAVAQRPGAKADERDVPSFRALERVLAPGDRARNRGRPERLGHSPRATRGRSRGRRGVPVCDAEGALQRDPRRHDRRRRLGCPTLVRAVGLLAGRRSSEGESLKS